MEIEKKLLSFIMAFIKILYFNKTAADGNYLSMSEFFKLRSKTY